MKSKSLISVLAVALFACAAAATTAQAGASPVLDVAIESTLKVTEMTAFRHLEIAAVVALPGQPMQVDTEQACAALPVIQLVRADQYAMQQHARQRPLVTPSWREVPSG